MQTMFRYAPKPNGSDRLKHSYRIYKVLTHAHLYLVVIQIVPNQPEQSDE